MKKGLRIAIIVGILLALLCGAAMAEISGGTGTKAAVTAERSASFLSSPYLYGPSNVRISANGLKARVSWSGDYGSYVSGYVVYECKRSTTLPSYLPYGWYTKRPDGYYWYPVSQIGTTSSTYMDIEANKAGTYYIEVDSYYLSPSSYVSSVGGFATFTATSSSSNVTAPKTVTVEQKGKNKVKVTWSAGEGAKSYAVYRATGSGSFQKIATTKKLNYTDKKATNGKKFRYKIQAINGKKTKFSKAVTAYPMAKPTSVKAKNNKDGTVTITWGKVKGAKKYLVYQRRPGSTDFTQVGTTTGKKLRVTAGYGDGLYKYYVVGAVGNFKGMKSSYASANVTGSAASSVTYRALIVANTYTGSNTLNGTANDAVAMNGALKGMSQPWNVTVKRNVDASDILSAISSTFAGSDADDICLFYYSGHGVTSSGSASGALCGNYSGYVYMSELASALDAACGGKVIVLLDSCGSGAGINKGEFSASAMTQAAIDAFSKKNRTLTDKYGELCGSKFSVLAAASKHTTSYDLNTSLNGYNCGAFTYSLLTSLGASYPNGAYDYSMPADSNGDRALSLLETYNGICSVVSQHGWDSGSSQHTQYYGDNNMILFERKN